MTTDISDTSNSDVLFHYTDTMHLPFILAAERLVPGKNSVGGFPDPEFVWATTSRLGDATSALMIQPNGLVAHRQGMVLRVRIELPKADYDFFHWSETTRRFPQWTIEHCERLERCAPGKSLPSTWWCHDGPVKIHEHTKIYLKDYRSGWRLHTFDDVLEMPEMPHIKGVRVGNSIYGAMREDDPGQPVRYTPFCEESTPARMNGAHGAIQ